MLDEVADFLLAIGVASSETVAAQNAKEQFKAEAAMPFLGMKLTHPCMWKLTEDQ